MGTTRLNAAMNAWIDNYDGKQVDYNQWLLKEIAHVTEHDVKRALITYLVPIFDSKSNLSVACPTTKAEEIANFFEKRGWEGVQIVPEDKLTTAFTERVNEMKCVLLLTRTG